MKQLLTAALVLASLLSAQAAQAQDTTQAAPAQTEAAAPAPQPVVIGWDRVGSKERSWV
jgi:opacity protein-like surface antigen